MIMAPNHLSYADWAARRPVQRYEAGRYPVFLIKSSAFDVKCIGALLRGSASCRCTAAGATRRWCSRQAEKALRDGRVRDRLPGGHRQPGPGPVADGGQDRAWPGWR